jgi:rubredoxin
MSYNYYYNNVKPKPQAEGKKGFACKICGWIYEGETLPEDIVCPLCKHGAADFEPLA